MRECGLNQWNSHASRANGTKEEIKNLNAYLNAMQARSYEAQQGLLIKNEPVTAENIMNRLRGASKKKGMILEVFKDHNNQVAKLVDKDTLRFP